MSSGVSICFNWCTSVNLKILLPINYTNYNTNKAYIIKNSSWDVY